MPKAYEQIESGVAIERFLLRPDMTQGRFDYYGNRNPFFSREYKINERSPEGLTGIQSRLKLADSSLWKQPFRAALDAQESSRRWKHEPSGTMTALQRAKNGLAELATALHLPGLAHQASHQQHEPLPKPRAVQLFIAGNAPIQLRDADTGRVLGFRQTYIEANGYARALEQERPED